MERLVYAVVAAELRPHLDVWAEVRTGQGWQVHFLAPSQLAQLQTLPAGAVLLCGHPRARDSRLHLDVCWHPPAYRHMATPFHSDHAVVHGALEAPPRHVVGRLAARSTTDLAAMVARAVAPAPLPPPTVLFVDGDPKWHPVINAACDLLAQRYVHTLLPAGITAQRASFNPRQAPAPALDDALAQGREMWVYVGHGQPQHVDGVTAAQAATAGPTRAVVLACCHAGALDGSPLPQDAVGVAEAWQGGTHGARAVLAGSNVTDPRLNPAVALAAVQACMRPHAVAGDMVVAAQRALLGRAPDAVSALLKSVASTALLHAHVGLYALLGDPTAPLR